MTTVFGEVATEYEDARPGYPVAMAGAIAEYLARPPGSVAEVGAGTGKGTAVFARLGGRLVCVEPDERMAALLRAKFPHAEVAATGFAQWRAPAGGVEVLGGALVWHLLDQPSRCALAHAALAPGGVLALIGRAYQFADPDQGAALTGVFTTHGLHSEPRPPGWIAADLTASGLFTDVQLCRYDTVTPVPGESYVTLASTFSPVRRLAPERRAALLAELRSAAGGLVHLELRTALTLARR